MYYLIFIINYSKGLILTLIAFIYKLSVMCHLFVDKQKFNEAYKRLWNSNCFRIK